MKRDKEEEIDNIFRKGLEPPGGNTYHMENDWDAMEQMLDKRKKRPAILYWLPILGSVAAIILIVIGWWLLKPVANTTSTLKQIAVKQKSSHSDNIASNKDTVGPKVVKQKSASMIVENAIKDTIGPINKGTGINSVANNSTINPINKKTINIVGIDSVQINNTINRQNNSALVAYAPSIDISTSPAINGNINSIDLTLKPGDYTKGLSKIKNRSTNGYRKQFAITVLASSDKNGVNSFQQSKPGNNAGIVFSLGLSKRFTISTGAIYSAKQYMTDFANYHTSGSYQFPSNPISVLADCKMFDIPLNIDYRVFGNFRNKISVGTGISSYLMLHENYQYTYAANSIGGPAQYNVPNPDKYLLSIANIQLTYERRINSSVGLTLQPYMKLPLSTVGASEVRLQTTGMAIGLTWNLNSASKP